MVVVAKVTALFACNVVKAPVPRVVAPIFMLLMLPAVPDVIVIVPAPVVVYDWAFVVVAKVTAAFACSVVNAPVERVVAPIDMLLIVPAVPDDIVIVPAPVVV